MSLQRHMGSSQDYWWEFWENFGLDVGKLEGLYRFEERRCRKVAEGLKMRARRCLKHGVGFLPSSRWLYSRPMATWPG